MKNELIFIGMANTLTDAYQEFCVGKIARGWSNVGAKVKNYVMTIGCKYQVADFREGLYILDDDNGLLITLSKEDFMSVEDWRDYKIDLIINE